MSLKLLSVKPLLWVIGGLAIALDPQGIILRVQVSLAEGARGINFDLDLAVGLLRQVVSEFLEDGLVKDVFCRHEACEFKHSFARCRRMQQGDSEQGARGP